MKRKKKKIEKEKVKEKEKKNKKIQSKKQTPFGYCLMHFRTDEYCVSIDPNLPKIKKKKIIKSKLDFK